MPITPTSTKSKQYQALGIDEIANDIDTAFTEVNSLQEQIDNLPQGGTTTVVNISSAQILAMGTTPIELLPVLPALSYYDIESILLEYTFVSTNYTLTEPLYAAFGFGEYFTISERIVNGNASVLKARVAGVIDQDLVATGTGAFINMEIDANVNGDTSLTLTTWNGTDPTLGDGTLRAIITYTTRTFGA